MEGQTHDDSKYRASIASHGKTRGVFDVDCVSLYGNYVMHWSVTQNLLFCTRAADLAGWMPGAQLNNKLGLTKTVINNARQLSRSLVGIYH